MTILLTFFASVVLGDPTSTTDTVVPENTFAETISGLSGTVATSTSPCKIIKKDEDCQTDGDTSAYCKDNNECYCSAPNCP